MNTISDDLFYVFASGLGFPLNLTHKMLLGADVRGSGRSTQMKKCKCVKWKSAAMIQLNGKDHVFHYSHCP